MLARRDKKVEKMADKALDDILKIYTSAIDSFNTLEEENNKKLYEYYCSSHIVRKCDYYKKLDSDQSIRIIKRKKNKVEYVQIGEHKTDVDESIFEEIKYVEERIRLDKINFEKMENTCKNFLNQLSDIESRFQKSSKSRDEKLQYLLENRVLELSKKRSFFYKIKNWFKGLSIQTK